MKHLDYTKCISNRKQNSFKKKISIFSLNSYVFFGRPCKYDYAFVYCSASGDAGIAQSAISSVCTGSDAFGDYIEVINIFGDYILR